MRMAVMVLVAAAALGGCATRVVSSSPRTVVVDAGRPPTGKAAEAQRLADAECSRYKRLARMVARPIYDVSTEYVFDCVE